MNSESQSLVPATQQAESEELTVDEVRESLSTTEKGQPANTIGNCRTVFCQDPLLRGAIRLNLLTDRVDIVRDLGWRRNTSALTDTDVKYLLLYFEQKYGLTSEKKLMAALSIVANENCYHPIQDVLNSLVWDGKPRIRSCLHHFLGADESNYVEEMHLLLREEQTAAYTVEIWKRFRKWGGIPTGITQNVKDLLSSREVENIFENSDYVFMLNQASGDRQILAKQLNISPHQLSYVTHSGEGEGLLFYGSTILPFVDRFPKDTELYRIITTKPQEQAG